MLSASSFAHHPYADFLHEVAKPARYTGGEVGARPKDWSAVEATVCLAFPDVYDIGMSHLGYKILYKILNDNPRTLAERAYAPWPDMEAALRKRGLPLVSHESARPLRDFDVVGLSLQFELTYTNCLTILDLGGIPLRACDRADSDPLVLGGGPTATHPEPMAVFFDAFLIGDGEDACSRIALAWADMKRQGVPRAERLVALSQLDGVYVPSLYRVEEDAETGLQVVTGTTDPRVPAKVSRAFVPDLSKFPFPSESPVGGPEAVFDRMSIEIARGCTEGCRFCQAGMIYRPVRERDPEEIVNTVVEAVKRSGYDEVSLTSLSTADASCISPLIKKVADKLTAERVSLGVSSLRAYGLEEDLLDEMRRVRANGLTFAPEAGTQRMRDVVNKNVTEAQLMETAERIFRKGWDRMKLYFMIGLPTEEDEDIRGIVETGARALAVGKRAMNERAGGKSLRRANVTVSVSTHVPKPHTPFQWCAMDTLDEVKRKQRVLYDAARSTRVDLKTHNARESVLEGIFARGDRRLGDVIEAAWRNGARFDSWEEHIKPDVWKDALDAFQIEPSRYLGTLPVTARLPWDHIHVGLEDGFLAKEYRKALRSKLSPPCGKAVGMFVHHTNVADALADKRKLVCYDCGVACDLTQMREERVGFLTKMGSLERPTGVRALPVLPNRPAARPPADSVMRYRFSFEKTGPMAFLGHLDLIRALPRVFRRMEVPVAYTGGFHPKPDLTFAPALSLGIFSLDEYVDIKLLSDHDPAALLTSMNRVVPDGLRFTGVKKLGPRDPAISKVVAKARYVIAFARHIFDGDPDATLTAAIERVMAAATLPLTRVIGDREPKAIDVRPYLQRLTLHPASAVRDAARVGLVGNLVLLEADVAVPGSGGVKVSEIVEVLFGGSDTPHRAIRTALLTEDGRSPLDDVNAPRPPTALVESSAGVAAAAL